MSNQVTKGTLTPTTDDHGRQLPSGEQQRRRATVHFNPETLNLTLTNTMQKAPGRQPAQIVTESVAKLSMDLIFDTTDDGSDVRGTTHKIARMMDPIQEVTRRQGTRRTRKVPAIVVFEWGAINFEGYIDSYKESIDFFSSEGIPLRATVSLSLTQNERTFAPIAAAEQESEAEAQTVNSPSGQSLDQTAGTVGNSAATSRLAEQNGLENIRLPERDEIVIMDEAGRQPVAFSSGSMTASLSSTIDVSVQQSPIEQAFAGLRTHVDITPSRPRRRLYVNFDEPTHSAEIGIGPATGFGITGQVKMRGDSMSANVGVNVNRGVGVYFED